MRLVSYYLMSLLSAKLKGKEILQSSTKEASQTSPDTAPRIGPFARYIIMCHGYEENRTDAAAANPYHTSRTGNLT